MYMKQALIISLCLGLGIIAAGCRGKCSSESIGGLLNGYSKFIRHYRESYRIKINNRLPMPRGQGMRLISHRESYVKSHPELDKSIKKTSWMG